jgi:uncharacterized integral membrane protein
LQVLRRAWKYVLGVPAAIILLTLAVINRHSVRLVLDPFRPDEPVLSLVLPFYAYLIGMLVIGIVIGGLATWVTQARWRRTARRRAAEAQRWQSEADRLARERQAAIATDRQLAPVGR